MHFSPEEKNGHFRNRTNIFTSYDNPKGNAETERMMRTIKEEVIWLHEFTSLTEAREVIIMNMCIWPWVVI